jgi:hypothetical protein
MRIRNSFSEGWSLLPSAEESHKELVTGHFKVAGEVDEFGMRGILCKRGSNHEE